MFFRVLMVLALGSALFSGWQFYRGLKEYADADEAYKELQEQEIMTQPEGTAEPGIDFAALAEINPDIRDLTNMPNDSQGTIRYGRLNMRSFLRRVKRDFAVWNQITPVPAGCAVCMTHLNEYDHCGARNKLVKYKSSSEEGAGCVTLNNNTR